jgi:hypothetical protein
MAGFVMQRIDERSLASGSFRQNAIETVRHLGFVSPKRHSEDLSGSFRQNASSGSFRQTATFVMAGHSRPKDGVAPLAYVPAIHALLWRQGVDARDKRGHDGGELSAQTSAS